jgi:RNA polymerase sigma-70 factor (ECF subfamily)
VETSDEALCERVAGRDEAAFDLLVERYQRRAFRVAWSILRDAEEARDVSQEAFIRLYQTAGSFGGRARFSTWFYRILVNLCLDQRRRRRWWRQIFAREERADGADVAALEEPTRAAADFEEALDHQRTLADVWSAAEQLSPQQRAALVLQVHEDLTMREIAAVLGCSEATVRVHLHRALSSLRRMLRKERT